MTRKAELAAEAIRKFAEGHNVMASLRPLVGDAVSKQDAIEITYDLLSGSYTEAMKNPVHLNNREEWGRHIAKILLDLGVNNACEVGVGEASTLMPIVRASNGKIAFSGFDISLSRVLFAREYARKNQAPMQLFCADLMRIPLADSSVDAVLTNQSIEPNGGSELPILTELLRVCRRFLVMVEPDYAKASPEQQARMTEHGYVRDLPGYLAQLPGRILRYEAWPFFTHALNKTSIIVFEKSGGTLAKTEPEFVSPVTKSSLVRLGDHMFCPEEGLLYPVLFGVPVLRDDCAIVLTHGDKILRGDLASI